MKLLVVPVLIIAVLIAWGISHDLRRWARGFFDDLDRARMVREHEEAEREAWTWSDVADDVLEIRSLTSYVPADWESRRNAA